MRSPIHAMLAPVRRRQQLVFLLRSVVFGLLASSLLTTLLAVGSWMSWWPLTTVELALILAAGPVLGLSLGLVWRRSWSRAAHAVDAEYQLKDRAATALAFVSHPARTVFHDLQISDTASHLKTIDPRRVAPLAATRPALCAGGSLAIAILVLIGSLVFPFGGQTVEAKVSEPIEAVVAEAERLAESLMDLEEAAKRDENKELEKLVEQLKEKLEEMKQPGVDVKEALAKLSEMQAAIAAEQAQYNTGLVDGQLQALGTAMTAATSLDGAGKALQEAKYDKAAEELEKLENPELDRKEAKAVEEKLKQVAQAAGEVGLGQLGEAISELAEGVKGNKGKFQKATKDLAKAARSQDRRRRVNNLLANAFDRFNEGKCNCSGGPEGKRPEKSNSPSNNWGRATSGNVRGDKTDLLSQRKMEQVTGTAGEEGDAEMETTHSAEGRQKAGRAYKDVYKDYRRMSEAVLDSEPIPLGHRQTIRKYFELIRPQNADEKKESDDGSK